MKTTISQRSLRSSSLLLLLFEFNNFSFLIDKMDNIIIRPQHVTRTQTNGSAVFLSIVSFCILWPLFCTAIGGSSGHVIRFGIILTQFFCQFLKTGRSDKCFIGIVKLLRFSGFSLYPLSFTVPIMLIVFNWSLMQIIQIRLSAVLKENFKFLKCWFFTFFTYWTEN